MWGVASGRLHAYGTFRVRNFHEHNNAWAAIHEQFTAGKGNPKTTGETKATPSESIHINKKDDGGYMDIKTAIAGVA